LFKDAGLKYLIFGPAGAGKTSISNELRNRNIWSIDDDHFGLWYDSTDNIVHNYLGTQEWRESHKYLWDLKALAQILQPYETVYFTGISTNTLDALPLFDKSFFLHATVDTYCQRLTNDDRKTNYPILELPEYEKFIKNHLEIVLPIIKERGCIFIDAEQPLNKVVEDILDRS